MSFTIPNIPFADPTVERPVPNSSPSKENLERLVDLERSIATTGRPIWGFSRLPETPTEPTRGYVFEEAKSDWMPLARFITRVPLLGAGPYLPTTGGGDIGFVVHAFVSDFDLSMRATVTRVSDAASSTHSPIPTIDTNGYLRWKIDDIPETTAGPEDLITIELEFSTPSAFAPIELFALAVTWLDITDIDP